MALTDTTLKNLKPKDKAYRKTDAAGLYVWVTTSGSRIWRMDYRFLGVRKTITFGHYPAVSLSEARAQRDQAKKTIASGNDPVLAREDERRAKLQASRTTFRVVADSFLKKLEVEDKRAPKTLDKIAYYLFDLARPLLDRPVNEIKGNEIFMLLKAHRDRGLGRSVGECRATLGRMFRYAAAQGLCEHDPTHLLVGAITMPRKQHFPAIIKSEEVADLVKVIVNDESTYPPLHFLMLAQMYLFPRPSELRLMRWDEVDLHGAVWNIPAERTKLRRPMAIPLPSQVVDILIMARSYRSNRFPEVVFPSQRRSAEFMSLTSMGHALKRLGIPRTRHVPHGFRSTASTILNGAKLENGMRRFDADVIEFQLAHVDKSAVRGIYNRWDYWDERVEMMQWYADHLDALAQAR